MLRPELQSGVLVPSPTLKNCLLKHAHACTHVSLELHIAIKTEREAENSGSLSDSTKKGGVGVFLTFFFLHLNLKVLGAFAFSVPHHGIQLSELKKYRRHRKQRWMLIRHEKKKSFKQGCHFSVTVSYISKHIVPDIWAYLEFRTALLFLKKKVFVWDLCIRRQKKIQVWFTAMHKRCLVSNSYPVKKIT